ncbi:type II restriction endonuclease [Duganella radicis]|uniref:Restriction endonuclease n=1 Tax=Duganella radicis TaxID=551988 RepID=A0A6L6PQM5_9BURK|nr:type II restriction endonuclease [Duganella radicis]MTV41406.1 restriction endonuclease [Duganella radicis]
MFNDKISDYIEGVAAKYLSAVDAEATSSNQHEIGGLVRSGFGTLLGQGREDYRYRVRQIYISDDMEEPVICDGHVTWYDTRRDDPKRGPEFRLYYYDSPVTELMGSGDFFLIAKLRQELPAPVDPFEAESLAFRPGSVLMVFAPAGSNAECQLRTLFGLDNVQHTLRRGILDTVELLLPLRAVLESMGIAIGPGLSHEENWLDKLLHAFGGKEFPKTSIFSEFARKSLDPSVISSNSPDMLLMACMEREESLFKIYERHIVKTRLAAGFGEDVEGFIGFSLSVQNRRKSRAGHAFEDHLNFLFKRYGLQFEQGRGKGMVTENNSKPDFIFPSFNAYRDASYPHDRLIMLGAKTTCKDRWRQVLSEAQRVQSKHLVTLEAAISRLQLEEMRANKLRLVVPSAIHATYPLDQRHHLMDMQGFIEEVQQLQRT